MALTSAGKITSMNPYASIDNDHVTPLPVNADPDPNGFMQPGPALSALDPSMPAPQQQPVGSALDAVAAQDEPYDAIAANLANGGRIRITSQEQFNALSEPQKAVVRAAVATGGKLRANDALRVYQDTLKQSRASQVQTVKTSDGRTIDMLNGQIIPPAKQEEPVKMERWNADDGTVMLTDPTTGRTFPAWNEQTGEPMRTAPKLSEGQKMKATPIQNRIDMNKGQAALLQGFTPDAKVKWNAEKMEYETPWMGGSTVQDEMNRLAKDTELQESKLINILNPSGNAPAKSSPAPKATPSPTPAAYGSPDDVRAAVRAGKIDRAAAAQILRSQFQFQ